MSDGNGVRADLRWIKEEIVRLREWRDTMTLKVGDINSGVKRIEHSGDGHKRDVARLDARIEVLTDRVRNLEAFRWKLLGACAAASALTGGGAYWLLKVLL